jgi:hypothetical protein
MPTVPLLSVSVETGLFELLEQLTAAVAVSAARAKRVAFPKSLITMTSDGFRSIDADGAESPVRRAPLIKDRAKRTPRAHIELSDGNHAGNRFCNFWMPRGGPSDFRNYRLILEKPSATQPRSRGRRRHALWKNAGELVRLRLELHVLVARPNEDSW